MTEGLPQPEPNRQEPGSESPPVTQRAVSVESAVPDTPALTQGADDARAMQRTGHFTVWARQGWSILGASVQGTAHVSRGVPCQDFHHADVEGDVLFLAACDGAGSAPLSDVGAALAARHAVRVLKEALGNTTEVVPTWPERLRGTFRATREALETRAVELGVPVQHLACTLLLAVVTPDATFGAQVGDGAIVVKGRDGVLRLLTEGQKGEYFNETVFITHPTALPDIAELIEPVEASAVLTDGLEPIAVRRAGGVPHPGFFAPLLACADRAANDPHPCEQTLREFLMSSRVAERVDDDVTLVMAVRTAEEHTLTASADGSTI